MFLADKFSMAVLPTKQERLKRMFDCLQQLPPARTGLEAYAQISQLINLLEDQVLGIESWSLPRTYTNGKWTDRMHPSQPECFESVAGYVGITNMVHAKQFVFISRTGAIEMQYDTKESERDVHFSVRTYAIIFKKPDACGRGVWDEIHKDVTESTAAESLVKPLADVIASGGYDPRLRI
jgi:hypothetical protein